MGRRTVPCKLCHGETRGGRFLPTDEARDVRAVSVKAPIQTCFCSVRRLSKELTHVIPQKDRRGCKREGGDGVVGSNGHR